MNRRHASALGLALALAGCATEAADSADIHTNLNVADLGAAPATTARAPAAVASSTGPSKTVEELHDPPSTK